VATDVTSGAEPHAIAASDVAARLAEVHARIVAAGGDLTQIRIVAVTKTFGPPAVHAALACGIVDVGENYARELLGTAASVDREAGGMTPAPRWHFLGSIQRRDVPKLAPVVSVYEGIDRIEEGEAIARHAPGATVYVELDESGIPGRSGVAAVTAPGLIASLRALDLTVAGVMTIAPPTGGAAAAAAFAIARRVADDYGLAECSMGMSDDLELAVAAGSTAIRIGRALFGARERPPRSVTMGG
jgi:hypothetical protein